MRDEYFLMFQELKYCEYYYFHYSIRSSRINKLIKGLIAIGASASLATVLITNEYKIIFFVIIIMSQILLTLEHLFPFSKQSTTLSFLLPDLRVLNYNIAHDFFEIDDLSDKNINERIYNYYSKYQGLEQKYIGDTHFPYSNKCKKKATQDCDDFFLTNYNVKCIEETEDKMGKDNKKTEKPVRKQTSTKEERFSAPPPTKKRPTPPKK